MKNKKETMYVDVSTFCQNYIEGKPVLTIEEASEIAGRDLDPFHEYYEIIHMGGTIPVEGVEQCTRCGIMLTEDGVMDEYGEEIFTKDAVKCLIDRLQEYYRDYDKYYDKYVSDYRKRVIDFVKKHFRKPINTGTESIHEQKHGYIYVMHHQGYYKIGRSVDCMRLGEYTRLAEEPEYVQVVYVKDMVGLEKSLHKKFAPKRQRDSRCEWFSLDQKDLELIAEILAENKQPIAEHTKGYRRYILHEDV